MNYKFTFIKLVSQVFVLLNFSICSFAWSQPGLCTIHSGMDISLLMNNKCRKIVEFTVDKISGKKDTITIYFLNSAFCPYKKVYKLPYVKNPGWMAMEFSANKDSTISVYQMGEYNGDSISVVYEKKTTYYNLSGQKIRTVHEEHYGLTVIETHEINPDNELDYKRTILKISEVDTIQRISYTRIPELHTYLVEEKHNGRWTESEKSITTYSNDKFETYNRYVNGKLVNSYTHKDVAKKDTDEENYNPLPYTQRKEITDTLYTKDASNRNYKQLQNKMGSKSDFKVIRYFDPFQKNKIYIVKMYYPSGLLHSNDNIPEKYYTLYEYR